MARCKKFIPDADSEFAWMARIFAANIAKDPARYMLSASDAAIITQAVTAFRDALAVTIRPWTRTKITIMTKDMARKEAERVVRRYASLIRVNDDISRADKMRIFVKERPKRLKRRKCPKRPPYLRYVGSGPASGDNSGCAPGNGTHMLEFRDEIAEGSRAKPAGAARLELFVDLVPPGEPVPKYPGERTGVPWYLRSFTKNPIEVEFPNPGAGAGGQLPGAMLVVYWGRWADATGEVGRFSSTAVARVEGWSSHVLPDAAHEGRALESGFTTAPPLTEPPEPPESEITEVVEERRMLEAA